jgi:nitroreductase
VTDPEARREVGRLCGEEEHADIIQHRFVSEAPVQIVICTSEKVYRDRYREPDKVGPNGEEIEWPVPYWHTDAGAALMLVLLAAVNEGLQTAFVGAPDSQSLREYLGIPEEFEVVGVAMIGHGAPDVLSPSLKRGRRPLGAVLHWEHW